MTSKGIHQAFGASGLVLATLCIATVALSAQRPQTTDAWNRTWRFKHGYSTGQASLGGIIQITVRPNRLVLVRPNGKGDKVAWSCATNGSSCLNDPLDGSAPTTSFVQRDGDRITIVTRAADRSGRSVELRRMLHVNNRGELVVETASSDDRFRGRSVYRAYRKQ